MFVLPAKRPLDGLNSENASVANWPIFEFKFSLNRCPDRATKVVLYLLFDGQTLHFSHGKSIRTAPARVARAITSNWSYRL
jgi:hypothetical protein